MRELLSVVIPVFNEEEDIFANLIEISHVFDSFEYAYEIIVVNDGSTDDSLNEIKKVIRKSNKIKLISYDVNKGKGHAIVSGVKKCSGNHITFLDADLEIYPAQLKKYFKYMKDNCADVVIGSKRHKDSVVNYPFHRKFLSDCYYFLNKILFNLPVKDTQAGLKLYKSSVLNKVINKIVVKGFAFDLEVLVNVHKNGAKIVECPIHLRFNRGFGRIGLKSILNIFWDTLGIFYRLRIIHFYD